MLLLWRPAQTLTLLASPRLTLCLLFVCRDLKKGFLLMPALQYIARNWPYWNRTGGKRHIIPMEGAACGRCLTCMQLPRDDKGSAERKCCLLTNITLRTASAMGSFFICLQWPAFRLCFSTQLLFKCLSATNAAHR